MHGIRYAAAARPADDRLRPSNVRTAGQLPPELRGVIDEAEARSSDPEKRAAAVSLSSWTGFPYNSA